MPKQRFENKSSLNSTMVRLKRGMGQQEIHGCKGLNSTMVRLKPGL